MPALVHKNQRCKVSAELMLVPDAPAVPKQGEQLVLEVARGNMHDRCKVIAWTFAAEWYAVRHRVLLEPTKKATAQTDPPVIASVAVTEPAPPEPVNDCQEVEPTPLAVDEMIHVLGFDFSHAILDALERDGLSIVLVREFVRNIPNGKKDGALWKQFHKRAANHPKKQYGIGDFVKDTLVEKGFIVKL